MRTPSWKKSNDKIQNTRTATVFQTAKPIFYRRFHKYELNILISNYDILKTISYTSPSNHPSWCGVPAKKG